jgi:hypothetical protein
MLIFGQHFCLNYHQTIDFTGIFISFKSISNSEFFILPSVVDWKNFLMEELILLRKQ